MSHNTEFRYVVSGKENNSVFIPSVPLDLNREGLRQFFSKYGIVELIFFKTYPESGKKAAVVRFASAATASKVISDSPFTIDNHVMHVFEGRMKSRSGSQKDDEGFNRDRCGRKSVEGDVEGSNGSENDSSNSIADETTTVYVKPFRRIPENALIRIVHVNGRKVFARLDSDEKTYSDILHCIDDYINNNELGHGKVNFNRGRYVLLRYSKQWHRAQMFSEHRIFCLDTGLTVKFEECEQIINLPKRLSRFRQLSFRLEFTNVPFHHIADMLSDLKFRRFLFGTPHFPKSLIVRNSSMQQTGLFSVELYNKSDDANSVNEKMNRYIKHVLKKPPPDISKDQFLANKKYVVTHIVDPSEFYLTHRKGMLISNLILEELPDLSDLNSHVPEAGEIFVCRHTDEEWRRVRILNMVESSQGNKWNVLYIDRGNKGVVKSTNLRRISSQLLEVPISTYKCSVAGFNCKWNTNLTEKFVDFAYKQKFRVTDISKCENGTYFINAQNKNGETLCGFINNLLHECNNASLSNMVNSSDSWTDDDDDRSKVLEYIMKDSKTILELLDKKIETNRKFLEFLTDDINNNKKLKKVMLESLRRLETL